MRIEDMYDTPKNKARNLFPCADEVASVEPIGAPTWGEHIVRYHSINHM
jgi:hypothetical protein